MNKMISIIRKSLVKTNEDKLSEFNESIKHAMSLTEKKRYYIADFRHTAKQAIDWWRVKAAKRFEKLQSKERTLQKYCALI